MVKPLFEIYYVAGVSKNAYKRTKLRVSAETIKSRGDKQRKRLQSIPVILLNAPKHASFS